MTIEKLAQEFSVCQVPAPSVIDWQDPFCFVGKTDEELSLVCSTARTPACATRREDGWRAFRVQGTLDFSLIGILSRLCGLLAEKNIGVFAVSTYNTDYILTKASSYERALEVLAQNGYTVE